jgi:2-aminobenzoate-CoA ligase
MVGVEEPGMHLSPSAHVDTFTRRNLPPPEQWPELIFTLPELDYPGRLNCAEELLDATVDRLGPDRPCLVGETESWTYGQLVARADQVARVLTEDLGVVPGNRVLLRGLNDPWWVACWFGVMKAGAVAVPVLSVLRPGELATIARAAAVTHALCDTRFLDDLHRAVGDVGEDVLVVGYGGPGPDDLRARCDTKPTGFEAVATAADDVCLIAFTSGTTGRPKGCMHFHRDVLAVADTFSARVLAPRADDVFGGSPPLAFTFGLGGLVIFPLRVGASTVLLEKASPDRLLPAIGDRGISVLFTAPTAYRAMLADLDRHDVSTLRRCVSAGEHLPAPTWQAWHDATGVDIIDGIGATEMLHIFVAAADEDIRAGSTGRAVPGFVADVLDADGRPAPAGQPGDLAVRGPVGCRYLADERQTVYVRNGWNITGDTYVRDDDGYLWYRARSDDMIISAGYNISAVEVEDALLAHPDVAEAAVIGVPDRDRGQIVRAFVVCGEGVAPDDATVARLQEFVRSGLAPYKCPRAITFLDALPRTGTGKLQRYRLREIP